MNEIKEQNKRKTASYKVALKHLDWKAIKVEDYSTEELQACLEDILKPISSLRTLDEMINDYAQHHEKYDLKMHPDAPKLPRNAVMRFIDDNRDKFKSFLSQKYPNQPVGLVSCQTFPH